MCIKAVTVSEKYLYYYEKCFILFREAYIKAMIIIFNLREWVGISQFYEKFRIFHSCDLKCHGVDACKDTHSHNCHICDNVIRNVNHSFPSGLWESSSGGLWHSSTLSAFDKPCKLISGKLEDSLYWLGFFKCMTCILLQNLSLSGWDV